MESLVHLTNQCVPLPDSAFPYLASLYQHAYKTTPSQIHDLKSVRDETLRQFLVRELQFLMESKDGNSLVKLLNESQDNHLGKRTLQTAAENVSNASPNEAIEAFLNIKDETTRFWLVRIALEAAWSKGATEIPVDAMGRITEESETITAFQTSCISLSLLIHLRRSEEAFAEALKILPANLNAAKFEKSTRRRLEELKTLR